MIIANRKIPTYIMEEHNEAFLIWKNAIRQGILPEKGNFLLHVDEHSDMQMPRFNMDIKQLSDDAESIRKFTYTELDIATFITPLIFTGVISNMSWVRQRHDKAISREMYVRSFNHGGKKLIGGKTQDIKGVTVNYDNQNFMFHKQHVEDMEAVDQEVILDIDLDYFSCNSDAFDARETVIEITYSEYEAFHANLYHNMNFLGLPKLYAVEDDGKYYYVVNQFTEQYPSTAKVSEEEIERRVSAFIAKLEELKIRPAIIDICRSRHSGYTPADQWEFIERKVLEGLESLYSLDVKHIEELNHEVVS